MKVVSFNIRYDNPNDGKFSFENRRDDIKAKILTEKPDIIGFQEVLPHVFTWLVDNLDGYNVVGCGREADLSGEHMLIAYDRSKYDLLWLENKWLSFYPDKPGSMCLQESTLPRLMTAATLRSRDGKRFKLICAHFDHEYLNARSVAAKFVRNYVEKSTIPCIFMGDLNAEQDEECVDLLAEKETLTDFTEEVVHTFHDFGKIKRDYKLDYVFATKEFKKISASTWTDKNKQGIYLSDHYPVVVELEF